jgi:O-acetyl-ADP-ribose deacetylase (regulator of RNase III)
MVEKKVGDKAIRLVLGDITDLDVEAFVFDITADAKLGTGYGNAIAVRGGQAIQKELDQIGNVPTGAGVATSGGSLKAKYVIHVNGPKFHEPDTEGKLRRATQAALTLADEKGVARLALPPVGTGMYQVPLDLCARVMVETVETHLRGTTGLREVLFVALDNREFAPLKARIGGGA